MTPYQFDCWKRKQAKLARIREVKAAGLRRLMDGLRDDHNAAFRKLEASMFTGSTEGLEFEGIRTAMNKNEGLGWWSTTLPTSQKKIPLATMMQSFELIEQAERRLDNARDSRQKAR